jgi:hypothetical protein
MLETAILGILSSIATELVTYLNKKLTGTVLAGNAALLLAVFFAFAAGVYRALLSGASIITLHDVVSFSVTAFGFSSLYFETIAKWFGLQVKSD